MNAARHGRRPAHELRHLWVRAPNWVGDLVMATPVLEALVGSSRFERVSIGLRSHLAGVVEGLPWADRVVTFKGARDEMAALARAAPDGALLLTNSFSAALRVWRAGVPLRAGTALGGRGMLLTHRLVPPSREGRRVPIPTAHLLADLAGLVGVTVPDLAPRLAADAGVRARARAVLVEHGAAADARFVLCAPGAAFGAAKLWPPERFAAVLDRLFDEQGWIGVVTGAPSEGPQIAAVVDACRHPVVSLAKAERDLALLRGLVSECELLVVGDSGPRWFAAAFDVPCVSIMGPNFPELTATSLERARIVRRDDLECSPCLRRVCPLEHHACMREIGVDEVVAAALDVVGTR
ncbi:MAG: glycosyltransferase family 9 protein [Planctomycetota bacterium]